MLNVIGLNPFEISSLTLIELPLTVVKEMRPLGRSLFDRGDCGAVIHERYLTISVKVNARLYPNEVDRLVTFFI